MSEEQVRHSDGMQREFTSDELRPDAPTPGETRRGRELLGLPVYSIAEGKHLGEISGLRVRREDCSVPVLRVKQAHSGKQVFLTYDAIKTVGVDIALVESEMLLSAEVPPAEADALESDLPGRPVFTQSGESAGHLAGFGLDTATGKIAFFRVEANTGFLNRLAALGRDKTIEVPAAMVLSLGPDAVIVQDGVKELLHPPKMETEESAPASQQ
jgi:sporulation protein YlmC with PRC-barrel domain